MNSFIPEEDMPAFERFLTENNLASKTSLAPPQPGNPPAPPAGGPAGRVPLPPHHQGSEVDSYLSDKGSILTTNF